MIYDNYDILILPIVTEKATTMSEHGKIVFKVPLKATKPQIKSAVEALFKVKVEAVNTLRQKGKKKLFKGKVYMRSDLKKAIITLKEGQTIDVAAGL